MGRIVWSLGNWSAEESAAKPGMDLAEAIAIVLRIQPATKDPFGPDTLLRLKEIHPDLKIFLHYPLMSTTENEEKLFSQFDERRQAATKGKILRCEIPGQAGYYAVKEWVGKGSDRYVMDPVVFENEGSADAPHWSEHSKPDFGLYGQLMEILNDTLEPCMDLFDGLVIDYFRQKHWLVPQWHPEGAVLPPEYPWHLWQTWQKLWVSGLRQMLPGKILVGNGSWGEENSVFRNLLDGQLYESFGRRTKDDTPAKAVERLPAVFRDPWHMLMPKQAQVISYGESAKASEIWRYDTDREWIQAIAADKRIHWMDKV